MNQKYEDVYPSLAVLSDRILDTKNQNSPKIDYEDKISRYSNHSKRSDRSIQSNRSNRSKRSKRSDRSKRSYKKAISPPKIIHINTENDSLLFGPNLNEQ